MKHPQGKPVSDSIGRTFFWLRNILAGLPLVYAMVSRRWEWENDWVNWSLAAGWFVAGVALRNWASAHCHYGQLKEKHLAVTGPYALVRNPLYIGNMFIITGATFASDLIWLVPVSFLWAWAVYSLVGVGYEEPRLLKWYGEEYLRYRRATPAWIPLRPSLTNLSPVPWRAMVSRWPILFLFLPFVLKELSRHGWGLW